MPGARGLTGRRRSGSHGTEESRRLRGPAQGRVDAAARQIQREPTTRRVGLDDERHVSEGEVQPTGEEQHPGGDDEAQPVHPADRGLDHGSRSVRGLVAFVSCNLSPWQDELTTRHSKAARVDDATLASRLEGLEELVERETDSVGRWMEEMRSQVQKQGDMLREQNGQL